MAEELDEAVNDIIAQLKQNNKASKAPIEESVLNKEDLEDFLIQNSGKLIKKSLSIVDNVNDYISSAPENRDVAALAELIKASTGAIETLNKLVVQDKKSNTTIKAKELDIQSKKQLQSADQQHSLMLSREEVLDRLLKKANVIDVDKVETETKT